MKIAMQEDGARPVKIWTEDIEPEALEQLKLTARLPFVHPHGVAAMPDVHAGIGATVGSVIATRGAVVPAAVGVDIGCGMVAVKTSLTASDLPDDLKSIRNQIERDVPVGFNQHKRDVDVERNWAKFAGLNAAMIEVNERAPGLRGTGAKMREQLGTLGGGNHFIEICLDTEQNVWVMLHSGSRGIGNEIGRHFIALAKKECEKWGIALPHSDLAYLPQGTDGFDDYVACVEWAQQYAAANREVMLELVIGAMRRHLPAFKLEESAINCHHNYISRENHFGENLLVTRKGAIRAREGDLGIIPGSMGQRSYIVRGLGNKESYCSCSHGAGRRMSRTAARKTFSLTDLLAQTEGVECRKDEGVLDEIPGAYKDVDKVMSEQTDLVSVVAILKQVLCVKG